MGELTLKYLLGNNYIVKLFQYMQLLMYKYRKISRGDQN